MVQKIFYLIFITARHIRILHIYIQIYRVKLRENRQLKLNFMHGRHGSLTLIKCHSFNKRHTDPLWKVELKFTSIFYVYVV